MAIQVALDHGELSVHAHAFFADPTRRSRHPLRTGLRFRLAVHPLHGAADILGARDSERAGASIAGFEQVLGQFQ